MPKRDEYSVSQLAAALQHAWRVEILLPTNKETPLSEIVLIATFRRRESGKTEIFAPRQRSGSLAFYAVTFATGIAGVIISLSQSNLTP